jgi:hypothetical protein
VGNPFRSLLLHRRCVLSLSNAFEFLAAFASADLLERFIVQFGDGAHKYRRSPTERLLT